MVKPKKHLGQHFLTDLSIAENLVSSIETETPTIIEIGPGTGVLTQFLIPTQKKIIAYEVDTESVAYLKENFTQDNFSVIEQDFLSLNLSKTYKEEVVIAGNFPYNISSQIVFKILDYKTQIPEMVGMFQKEVAERICATHGNKTYGILSVLTQAYYTAEYLFTVEENVFHPPPKVKSAVIRLKRHRLSLNGIDSLLTTLVKTGFNQRRKKLSNALKTLQIPLPLQQHRFMNLRAEQLSITDFIQLAKLWNEHS